MRTLTNDPEILEQRIAQELRALGRPIVRPLTQDAAEALAERVPEAFIPLVLDLAKLAIHRLNSDPVELHEASYGHATQIKTEENLFKFFIPQSDAQRGAERASASTDAELLGRLDALRAIGEGAEA